MLPAGGRRGTAGRSRSGRQGRATRRHPWTICPTRSRTSAAPCARQALADVISGKAKAVTQERQHGRQGRAHAKARRDQPAAPRPARTSTSSSAASDRPDLHDPRRVRQPAAPELPRPGHRPEHPGPDHASTARCTTRSPQPDRTKSTTRTVWQPDYNRQHYQDLYFGTGKNVESLKTYYEKQSSGRYTRRRRGHRLGQGQLQRGPLRPQRRLPLRRQRLHQHLGPGPGRRQPVGRRPEAAGRTDAADQGRPGSVRPVGPLRLRRRRQLQRARRLHRPLPDRARRRRPGRRRPAAGRGRHLGHRWYAFGTDAGLTGPAGNLLGGTQIGDTGIWVGDYTIQPENGGLSVFAHEYGHDLGLPDDYDTAGGGDNDNEYWTLMAQSRLSAKGDQAIGTRPGDLGAWDKLQLGWLDYEIVRRRPEEDARTSARTSTTPRRRRRRRGAARQDGHHRPRRPVRRRRSSGGPATATTWTRR